MPHTITLGFGRSCGLPTLQVQTDLDQRSLGKGSFLLFKLRGLDSYPGWDFLPLLMPAFAGRTLCPYKYSCDDEFRSVANDLVGQTFSTALLRLRFNDCGEDLAP